VGNIFSHWFGRFTRIFAPGELKQLDRQQIDELARDVGVTSQQLISMEARGSGAADQLPERLRALHLDEKQLPVTDWATLRDMQRVCSVCGAKWQCEKDLRDRPDDPKWQEYCPNAETLRGLIKR